ncbi:MAG TPA: uroporphyrinogen-III C-methyltransferase [Opitutaceae bacterium]|nr:uroporphyrinogen-III C-methyltransferase [Opitutaceae bacterium]
MSPGTVYIVGAGPGDPELLTLKARRVLAEADVVVYDQLVSPEVLDIAPPGCERLFAGKKAGQCSRTQLEIDEALVRLALGGKTVVRLKGGDPFVFGRGGEEAAALASAGVPFEIVPGVTSALAAAAYAGVPLTHRSHSSAIVLLTGHEDPSKPGATVRWEDYARLKATLCIYMGVKNLPMIARRLEDGGLAAATPAVIVQSATTEGHRRIVGTLGTIAGLAARADVGSPAMIIIGEVAAFSDRLAWFEAARRSAIAR